MESFARDFVKIQVSLGAVAASFASPTFVVESRELKVVMKRAEQTLGVVIYT
jgi:hypothetical protein